MAAKQIEMSMEVPVCAWCRRRKLDPDCEENSEVSHGICPKHQRKLIAELHHDAMMSLVGSKAHSNRRHREPVGELLLPFASEKN